MPEKFYKPRIREVIVVEGRYDKNTLAQIFDADIITLDGFAVFHDREKIAFLRRVAEKRGVVVLTDSDGAGFVLRRYLKGALPREHVRHAYIPDITGKERRKRAPGKEHKLGVEGMRPDVLREVLRRSGATFLEESHPACDANPATGQHAECPSPITKADLMEWGLSGGPDSAQCRKNLLQRLSLPEKLSANAMLDALNLLCSREEIRVLAQQIRARDPASV